MSKLFDRKKNYIILADFLIVLMSLILICITIKDPIITSKNINLNLYIYSFVLPVFIICFVFLCFGLFVEYKFNKLCLKNIVLLISGIIFFNNLLMNFILPSHFVLVTYNNVPFVMDISISQRIYSILICGSVCISPFLFIYVIPKILYTKKSIKFFLLVYLIVISVIAFSSFITDFDSYINIIKSGFTDYSKVVTSILHSKYTFSLFLFVGIVACTVLERLTNKKIYIALAICFFLINIFTYSKLPILLSFIYLIIYFGIKLWPIIFKNNDNKRISLICSIFCLSILTSLIVMTINSNSGILFKVKSAFQNVIESSKKTFSSRLIIWESAFNTLKPYQYIFGFGFYLGDIALNISYNNNPKFPSWENTNIFHCHNAYIECIQLGGIIYLLFYILIIVIFIKYILKIRKKYKDISTLMFAFLGYVLINGITDSFILFSDSQYIVCSTFFSLLVMGLYNYSFDENQLLRNKKILENSKKEVIKENDKWFVKLNKNINSYIAKDIMKDRELNKRIEKYNIK